MFSSAAAKPEARLSLITPHGSPRDRIHLITGIKKTEKPRAVVQVKDQRRFLILFPKG